MEPDLVFFIDLKENALQDVHLARLLHVAYHILLSSPYVGAQMRDYFLRPQMVQGLNLALPENLAPIELSAMIPLHEPSGEVYCYPFNPNPDFFQPPPLTPALILREVAEDADLSGMQLGQINFHKKDFTKARFTKCQANYSVFTECVMTDTDLSDASLVGAQFHYGVLQRCHFSKSNLRQIYTEMSHLEQCDFSGANLRNARLNSCFSHCRFSGADLCGALFGEWTELTVTEDLYRAKLDENQILWLFYCIYGAMESDKCAGKTLPQLFLVKELQEAVKPRLWA